jgi:lysozyme
MIKGIDISTYQGPKVNFHDLKDNLDFVIIRSTYGNGYKDSDFEINRDGARAVGLCIGFYHFAYPQYNTPEAEATWFTKTVSCLPGEIIILDFEEPYANPVDWCKRFLDKCTSNMGFKPLLYINLSTAKSFDWTPIIKAGYGLWLAHYDNNNTIYEITQWPFIAFKQYWDKGNVAGITPVDLDIFNGSVDQFKKYGNPVPQPPQPAPEPTVEAPNVPAQVETTTPVEVVTVAEETPVEVPATIPTPVETPIQIQVPNFVAMFIQWLLGLFAPRKK